MVFEYILRGAERGTGDGTDADGGALHQRRTAGE